MDDKEIIEQQAEEIRQLQERIAELEGDEDWPVPECIRARSKPVTAESLMRSMRAVSDAQDRAAAEWQRAHQPSVAPMAVTTYKDEKLECDTLGLGFRLWKLK